MPRGDDDDLGLGDVRGEIAGPGMAHGHGGVLAHEEEGRGHADDRRTPDDDRRAALDLDPGPSQDLDGGMGRGGEEAVVAEPQQTGVERMDPVDVLCRIDRIDHGAEPDRGRERHLHDDAIDGRVLVERADLVGDARLGRLALQLDESRRDPHLRGRPQDLFQVDGRWRVLADDDHGEGRSSPVVAPELLDILGNGLTDLGGDRGALQQPGARHGHRQPSGAGIGSRASPPRTT